MTKNVRGREETTGINCSVTCSKHEVAQLFSCLTLESQDELLSVMREMVKLNAQEAAKKVD